jgi:hypothetical protein
MTKNETPKTTFRFPAPIKKKLIELAELDTITFTQVVTNLINNEHRQRREEIKEHRKELKNDEKLRLNEINPK